MPTHSPTPPTADGQPPPAARPVPVAERSLYATAAQIAARVYARLAPDSTSLLVPDETGECLCLLAHRGIPAGVTTGKTRTRVSASLSGLALRERRPLLLHGNLKGTPYEHLAWRPDVGSAISLPVEHRGQVVGVVNIARLVGNQPYTDQHVAMLERLAGEIAAELAQVATRCRQLARPESPQETAPSASPGLAADPRALSVLHLLLREVTGAALTFVCLLSPQRDAAHLHVAAPQTLSPQERQELSAQVARLLREQEGVALPAEAISLHQADDRPVSAESPTPWRLGELLAAPLIRSGELQGLVGGAGLAPWPRPDQQKRVLAALGSVTAVLLEKAQLLAQMEHHLARDGLLIDFATQAAGALELGQLLESVRQAALRSGPCVEQAWVCLFDGDGLREHPPAGARGAAAGCLRPLSLWLIDSALWHGVAIRYPGPHADQAGRRALQLASLASLLVAPMAAGGRPLGALSVASSRPHAFDTADHKLLSALASRAAVAVESARLYGELGRQKRHTEAVIRHMADGVVVLDREQRIVSLNPAAQEMLGLKEEEVLGWSLNGGTADPRFQALLAICQPPPPAEGTIQHPHLLDAEPSEAPLEVAVLGATPRVLRVLSSPILPGTDDLGGEIRVLHDVTRERELEQMQKDFVSTVSHELRTPLFSIKGFVDLILKGKVPDPAVQQEFLTRVAQQADQLSAIVSNLLEASRLEAGTLALARSRVDLRQVVNEALARLESVAQSRGITMSCETPPALPPVLGDARQLEQVVINLVSNAIKFSPPESPVVVRCRAGEGEVSVEVVDRGIGIPAEAIPRLFAKFYQVDSSATRRVGGTGLGLYISRRIVEAHGGRIQVQSRPGEGSVFTFHVPIAPRQG